MEQRIGEFVDYYNNHRYHENLDSLTPTDVCFVRCKTILKRKENIKQKSSRNGGCAIANRLPRFQNE